MSISAIRRLSWMELLPAAGAGLLAGILPCFVGPLMALGAMAGLALAFFVMRNPRLGLLLTAGAIPLEMAGKLGKLSEHLPLTLAKMMLLLALAGWLVNFTRGRMPFRCMGWMYWIVAFGGACGVSLLGASEQRAGLEALFRLATTILFFFLAAQLADSPRMLKATLIVLILAGTISAGYAVVQRYLPGSEIAFRNGWEADSARQFGVESDIVEQHMVGVVKRSSGFAVHSIILGLNVCLLIPPLLALLKHTPRRDVFRRLGWVAVMGTLMAALVVTYSRTGLVLFVFCLLLAWLRKLVRVSFAHVAAAPVCLLVVLLVLPEKYYARVLNPKSYTLKSNSISTRLEIQRAAVQQWLDHPVLGIGFGNRFGVFDYYTTYQNKKEPVTPHNSYLQMLSQVGLIGLSVLLVFFLRLHVEVLRAIRRFAATGQAEMADLGRALNTSMWCFLFAGLALDTFDKGMPYAWLILGLSAAYVWHSARGACAGAPAVERCAGSEDGVRRETQCTREVPGYA